MVMSISATLCDLILSKISLSKGCCLYGIHVTKPCKFRRPQSAHHRETLQPGAIVLLHRVKQMQLCFVNTRKRLEISHLLCEYLQFVRGDSSVYSSSEFRTNFHEDY